jgi:hypothetical protein
MASLPTRTCCAPLQVSGRTTGRTLFSWLSINDSATSQCCCSTPGTLYLVTPFLRLSTQIGPGLRPALAQHPRCCGPLVPPVAWDPAGLGEAVAEADLMVRVTTDSEVRAQLKEWQTRTGRARHAPPGRVLGSWAGVGRVTRCSLTPSRQCRHRACAATRPSSRDRCSRRDAGITAGWAPSRSSRARPGCTGVTGPTVSNYLAPGKVCSRT